MPAVHRVGDLCSGHQCWSPRQLVTGASTVYSGAVAVAKEGSLYNTHLCGSKSPHTGEVKEGSSTVFVEGDAIGRKGDKVTCGGTANGASSTVFAN